MPFTTDSELLRLPDRQDLHPDKHPAALVLAGVALAARDAMERRYVGRLLRVEDDLVMTGDISRSAGAMGAIHGRKDT